MTITWLVTRPFVCVVSLKSRINQEASHFRNGNLEINACIVKRSFQPRWFDQWPWLDYVYSEESDSVLDEQPKAIYTHYYGHSLNLACSDTIRQSKIIKNAFNTANKIVNLVKKIPSSRCFVGSPERRAVITFTWYIRSLCPTRWTMNAECLDRILSNYKVLYVLWEESLD